MRPRDGVVVALLFLATCSEEPQKETSPRLAPAKVALGKVPESEVAVWQKVASASIPHGRYLQAVAFDEGRKVVVMFGGLNIAPATLKALPNKEIWEWSQATGKWTKRDSTGGPSARSGAAMVFDSKRGKFILFGGRAGSGYNLEDTWEWDPSTGKWTELGPQSHPTARSQHSMAYEKSIGKVLLFGGGRSDPESNDGSDVSGSMSDTWEYDPATETWSSLKVATAPAARHDSGMVWDSSRNMAILFGGMQLDVAGEEGIPKQDIWEWDPTAGTWSERTMKGTKPSKRSGHAMAFDGSRKKLVVFGGQDVSTSAPMNDLWDWDPASGTWTELLKGSEADIASPRIYASLVSDDADARLMLVAGSVSETSVGFKRMGGGGGLPVQQNILFGFKCSRELWEIDPAKLTFTNRTAPLDYPAARYSQVMAYNPSTGKTYLFGGYNSAGQTLNDLWAWDGKTWSRLTADGSPPARGESAMAYDPTRKSLILYGGIDYNANTSEQPVLEAYGDSWEWTDTKKWTRLKPATSPSPAGLFDHVMVTDTTRNKILLFGGTSPNPDGASGTVLAEVWEWDGATTTWTKRTTIASSKVPRNGPMAYDEDRQKLFVYDSVTSGVSTGSFWEWDPVSAGWAVRDSQDSLGYTNAVAVAYDSQRRRQVLLMKDYSTTTPTLQTWEVDTKTPTWYQRTMSPSPASGDGATVVFDSGRNVMVHFGGNDLDTGDPNNEIWEFKVSNLSNGAGCTSATAASCASGNCVEGVCCDVADCTGKCNSCNVPGSEGTCVQAKAGAEVPGSCKDGLACDASGACKNKNGQICSAGSGCASGFCVDGVCCNRPCTGTCVACNIVGQEGICRPYPSGTDPLNECGKGTGVCKSTCDGVGDCAYPEAEVTCDTCKTCDGSGTCTRYHQSCANIGGSGGMPNPSGGAGGSTDAPGGAGGGYMNSGGAGGRTGRGGAGGTNIGGTGGRMREYDGSALDSGGSMPGNGGMGAAGSSVGIGGNRENLDAAGEAASDNLSGVSVYRSGCNCELGKRSSSMPSMVFLAAFGCLLLVRKRRRGNGC
jgi:N-acetylneuraminic acid mutarotase